VDDRVYDVVVCAACGTQLGHNADGEYDPCVECSGLEERVLRVRVARDTVIAQIKPRQFLVEKSVYFGCVGRSGHYYFDTKLRHVSERESATPWGTSIDGGLFPRYHAPIEEGEAHVFHKDGWTAVAFPDRSVDRRPGSWSVFCVPAVLDGPEALDVARAAFPAIFARYGFEVVLAGT
jgi:hypothetical protein